MRHDYDGMDGPPAHPDLKRFGAKGQHHIAAHFGVNQDRIVEILTGKTHPEARLIAMSLIL